MQHQQYKIVGNIKTQVTYLSMDAKPLGLYLPKISESVSIKQATSIDISLYRELYHKVGEPLTWTARKLMSDLELSKKIHSPNISIFVLRENASPIGFIEFEKNCDTHEVEIGLFGIIPEAYGKKIGIYLLNWGILHAWNVINCTKLWLHTCDLDHEKALEVYLRSGFTIYDKRDEFVDKIAST